MTDDTQDPTPRCRTALNSISRVRQEMCKIYRQSRSGALPLGDMTRLIFALSQIGKLIELESFEQRLDALEALPVQPSRLSGPADTGGAFQPVGFDDDDDKRH